MLIETLSTLVALFGTLLLIVIVYRHNSKGATNKLFLALSVALAFWAVMNYFSISPIFMDSSLLWIRLTIFFAVLICFFLFLFAHTIPRSRLIISKPALIILTIASLITMAITVSPYAFSEVEIIDNFPTPVPAPGIGIFGMYVILLISLAIYLFVKKYRLAKGAEKQQLLFVLVGALIMFGLIIGTIFLPVVLLQETNFVSLSPIYTLIFLGMTAYAIVRYRFMEVRFVISRSIAFAALVFMISTLVTILPLAVATYLPQSSLTTRFVIGVLSASMIVAVLEPLKKGLAILTDKIFFRAAIDYEAATRILTQVINDEIELSILLRKFTEHLEAELRIVHASILMPVGDSVFISPEELLHKDKHRNVATGYSLDVNSPLIQEVLNHDGMIILDDLDRKIADAQTLDQRERYIAIRKNLEDIKGYVAIRITTTKIAEAIIILSKKSSGEAYSIRDIQLLNVIAPQMASGIEKARLYQEEKEFATTLKREVERATSDLKVANSKLKELDQAKSEFMSIASHQLRTPLAGIMGYLSMIVSGDYGKINPEQKPIILDVLDASQRLIRMVNVFLNATRIEAGRFVMNYKNIPFSEVIEAEYKELKPTADKKGVKLIYKKKKLPNVDVDTDKIKDVVLNLIDNAIKYTPEGSVTVWGEATKKTVILHVKDSGVGIPKAEVKNLFNKFVRGSGIARVDPSGSGLGLFIAKKITEGHGGKIWAESEGEGKGSTFSFEIPIKANKEAVKKSKEFQNRAKKKKK